MGKHLFIRGRVQGVGYRAAFAEQARALGLKGWVRNRSNGSVEAMVWGAPSALEAILAWARQGPPAAAVQEVMTRDMSAAEPTDFSVRPTE